MSLRSDIETALAASASFSHSVWGEPTLKGLPDKPAVMTRYGGKQVVNGDHRPIVEVFLVYRPSTSSQAYDGLEDMVDLLIAELNDVDDCYPELLPVRVLHDLVVVKYGSQRYVSAIVSCVGI